MKKTFILSAALMALLLAISCGDSTKQSSTEQTVNQKKKAPERCGFSHNQSELYGDVESVTITFHMCSGKFGKVVKGRIFTNDFYRFNQKGDVVEHKSYLCIDGDKRSTYKYDLKGNMIEWTLHSEDSSTGVKSCYKYDDHGNQIEEAIYNHYGELHWKNTNTCKYDTSGNMIERANYDNDGSLVSKDIWKYDSQGNLIEEATYNHIGELHSKYCYKYNSQGNQIEAARYKEGNKLAEKTLYKYDAQGNMIEWSYYNADGSLNSKHLSSYDSQGNRIEVSTYNADGSLDHKTLSKYDSQGNLIENISYEGEMMTPSFMIVREIVYRK